MADRKSETPWLEWATGALGALLFIAILATLLSNAFSGADAAPSIVTRVETVEAVERGYVLKFVAVNQGDITAAQVRLEASLRAPGGEVERREVTFDYLAPHSERRGGFIFENDPRQSNVTISADGYLDP